MIAVVLLAVVVRIDMERMDAGRPRTDDIAHERVTGIDTHAASRDRLWLGARGGQADPS